MTILRWHVDNLPPGPMTASDLLFPSLTGGFASPSALREPFFAAAKAAGIRKTLTPKSMRRTFQDLARAADVNDVVTRRISGHATEAMQQHYSTVEQNEIRDAIGKVAQLAGYDRIFTEAHPGGAEVVREPEGAPDDDVATKEKGPVLPSLFGAGEGTSTLDVHLGKDAVGA